MGVKRETMLAMCVSSLACQAMAAGCTDFITASRQTSLQLSSQSEIEKAVHTFCSEYGKQTSDSSSGSFNFAYEVLSVGASGQNASVQSVYSKYCQFDSGSSDKSRSYQSYLSSIAPDVYPVVKACLELESKRGVTISPSQITPASMQLIARNSSRISYTAKLLSSPSGDVKCTWDGSAAGAEVNPINLPPSESRALTCTRDNQALKSWVTIYDMTSGEDGTISAPWGAYSAKGASLDEIQQLREELLTQREQLRGAVISFDTDHCPAGWEEYKLAYGRFVRGVDRSTSKIDPDGTRSTGSVQEDDLKKHLHQLTLGSRWGDKPGGTNPAWGNDDGSGNNSTASTAEFGGSETRPKNVALLYCRKL